MSPDHPVDEATTARAVIDADGLLVEWNAGAERLLGHSAAEVLGRPAANLLADAGADGTAAPDRDRWDGVVTLRRRDGGTLPVWVLAHRLRCPQEGPDRWLVVTPLDPDGTRKHDDPLDDVSLLDSPCAMVIYDERLRVHSVNSVMAEVLDLPAENVRGLRTHEMTGMALGNDLEGRLHHVLTTGRGTAVRTYVPVGGDRTLSWLARIAPIRDTLGRVRGVSVAAHDFTEQHQAQKRLQLVNEASVRIGTTLDVTTTAQELADICVPALADFVSVDLLDPAEHGELPEGRPVAPIGLRRTAHKIIDSDGGGVGVVKPGQLDHYPATSPQADALLAGHTIVASDTTGDLDQWLSWDPQRADRIKEYGIHTSMSVPIQARGTTLGVAVLSRFANRQAFSPDDVLLAEEVTARAAVCIDNARRYSRERETALALQRSLLPRSLPSTAALEAASRYLPAARSGVGGDWFDVIPLSGMRVAMVVGDVVGHGIQASATMGRLRTAVRTLADIDLAPDELLTHLDDLVVRLSEEAGTDGVSGEVGATCLYAVYDPVSRRCTLARAGHPSPVMVPPGAGPVEIDLPAGPPLGLGGLPFESAEVELREGTVLALYTDGLIETRERDIDASHALLCQALAASSHSLDETCDRVLHTLLPPGGVADDVALLVARTQGLPASRVATWDIPSDPALVAPIRKQVVEQIERWNLTEATFTAELVVSELVTNAIRYGTHPIRLRLIHDATTLICEVSDTSHTAPHLRRAKTYDEGGRGLLLVAQLTQRWGSRHTADGKTIWAEIGLLGET
ncbi:SpoIIE family protein phosphatase [Streptomyces sp. RK62]|uniref:SpoIIE family protein phosphatase n=1 Tax=Streptomyces sp. RK62 TaxID=2824893 RepID=UPI001B3669D9|nr:SpoIIE family protein phosphatase [Streptomyces sp. RK62]MBQ0995596.1 SpoIIE family protein phosphatase [Streptomyces sp. RK62]